WTASPSSGVSVSPPAGHLGNGGTQSITISVPAQRSSGGSGVVSIDGAQVSVSWSATATATPSSPPSRGSSRSSRPSGGSGPSRASRPPARPPWPPPPPPPQAPPPPRPGWGVAGPRRLLTAGPGGQPRARRLATGDGSGQP